MRRQGCSDGNWKGLSSMVRAWAKGDVELQMLGRGEE